MTYEQASVRGLVVRRSDETLLTFRDTVRHHFVASISTLETAAVNREKLLSDFYQYRVTAIEEGRKEPIKEYILPRGRDAAATDKLAGILMEHGIEVNRATAAFKVGEQDIRRRHLRGADGAALQAFHPHAAGPGDQDGR